MLSRHGASGLGLDKRTVPSRRCGFFLGLGGLGAGSAAPRRGPHPSARRSRSVSALYSVSGGVLISNSRSFVFGPSLVFQRTDVSAYGSAVELALPFEWITRKNLRFGLELALGHAFGGVTSYQCYTAGSPP